MQLTTNEPLTQYEMPFLNLATTKNSPRNLDQSLSPHVLGQSLEQGKQENEPTRTIAENDSLPRSRKIEKTPLKFKLSKLTPTESEKMRLQPIMANQIPLQSS